MDPGKPPDIVDLIKDNQCQDLANTRNRSQQIQGVLIMVSGGFSDMPFERFKDLIERLDHSQIAFDTFAHLRVIEAFRHSVMVVFA